MWLMHDPSKNIDQSLFDNSNAYSRLAFEAMEYTDACLFITGKAGTGKSTLLRYFVANSKKQAVVLAPTGIAAINVGGVTIHSFFRLPFRPIAPDDDEIQRFPRNSEKFKIIQKTDVFIIDEVSMLRADIIDAIDQCLRLNTGYPDKPFGGKQVVFFGDLFQLEPVVQQNEVERYLFEQYYNSHYFFDARVFRNIQLHCIELRKIYRQNDAHFIALLDKIRLKQVDEDDLLQLNRRVDRYFEPTAQDLFVTLTTRNHTASGINEGELNKLPGAEKIYQGAVSGEFNLNQLPTEKTLVLKQDAQIIFIKNSAENKWVNGTVGKIKKLEEDIITVELNNGEEVEVLRELWENKRYYWDNLNRKVKSDVIGTFKQFPIKLAWAITIHKSQGLTFDKVIIELGGGTFAHGQLYVALSRCRTLEGIVLREAIKNSDIKIDDRVIQFAKNFASLEDA